MEPSPLIIIEILIAVLKVGISSALLYVYTKSYKEIKIGFTVGLILFALIMLIKNIGSVLILVTLDIGGLPGPPIFGNVIMNIIELIGLIVLLKITIEY
ncbi:MAG: hypothetical protein ACRCVG_06535 [Methanobacteriaceae archaeon]